MKKDTFRALSLEIAKKANRTAQPSWIPPMLATLTKDYFSDPHWIYETKFDGIRIIAYRNGSKIRLMSRNKQLLNSNYPELVKALLKQKSDSFIIDGEVVALQRTKSSFEKLQKRMKNSNPTAQEIKKTPLYYYIFDMMYVDGYEIIALPLLARKKLLKKIISFKDPLRYSEHKIEKGLPFFKATCHKGLEGIMAKQAESTYQTKRSRDWLKFKCVAEQELVIGGYTEPQGSRTDFGALLMGYYHKGKLHYAGKVGTGFDQATLQELGKKLSKLRRSKCPFAHDDTLPKKNIAWVNPKLVAQIGFEEWTKGGKLRQPRYMGLRTDKKAKDVVREMAK